MEPAFMLYAMEQEGDMPTKTGKMMRVIKELSSSYDPNSAYAQECAFRNANLDIDSLSSSERSWMENEIARRWNS